MRTTLALEDDAFAMARACAQARSLTLGQAVSYLIRRAIAQSLPLKRSGGVWFSICRPRRHRRRASRCASCSTSASELRALAGRSIGIAEAAQRLLRNTGHRQHGFLPLDFELADVLGCCSGGLLGHRQVTDAFLLTLAIRSGVRLVTFDGGIGQLLATPVERQRHLRVLTGAGAA